MNAYEETVKKLVRFLYYIAGASIVTMMMLTCVDVSLRLATTLYSRLGWQFLAPFKPIAGSYELACLCGVIAAAFAMAKTTLEKGHVSVNFVTRLLPKRIRAGLGLATTICSLAFFLIVTWQSYEYALNIRRWNEVSMTLRVPFYPFVFGIAFSALIVCSCLVLTVIKYWDKVKGK